MLSAIRKLTRSKKDEPLPAIPQGERVYAIGDIHGCLAQFDALLEAIAADEQERGAARTTLVLLGDLIDRGPDSAGVIERAMELSSARDVRILMGNHEEMFLESFEDMQVLRHFLRYGGQETLLSYPIKKKQYRSASLSELHDMMFDFVPKAHRKFIKKFENSVQIGDYLFVHAGIRPGIPLEEQKKRELRWIREPFLSHRHPHERFVVHGHTISDEVDERPNRIGVDTGAYASGRLTALGLEGTARWIIEASGDPAAGIEIAQRSLS